MDKDRRFFGPLFVVVCPIIGVNSLYIIFPEAVMKRLILCMGSIFVLLFSMNVQAFDPSNFNPVNQATGNGIAAAIENGAWANPRFMAGLDFSLDFARNSIQQDLNLMERGWGGGGYGSSYSVPAFGYFYNPYSYYNYNPWSSFSRLAW